LDAAEVALLRLRGALVIIPPLAEQCLKSQLLRRSYLHLTLPVAASKHTLSPYCGTSSSVAAYRDFGFFSLVIPVPLQEE
ncbi:hypothetical protein, partial [Nostoc sp.]